ncbi:mucin-5AC isoform X2 [Drosophila albomicans]|uniref:Mucin-5AC isoform X2 n=1 Tax=Drosophila albomicans TaxID=7291 RepID=A0A6P8WYI3_DROAB|nr:mucin-5AC isoform X2 [Drosophila albomicans]
MHARNSNSRLRSRSAAGVTATVTFALLLTLALLRIDIAAGRPDVRPSPFALELQPPLLEPAGSEGTEGTFNGKGGERAIDSYGNPIDALRPIDTPDGRKVVSAQGVQFEIPNYASGITEIRKPADDLLPPHIGELTTAASGAATSDSNKNNDNNNNENDTQTQTQTQEQAKTAGGLVAPADSSTSSLSFASTHISHNRTHNHTHVEPLTSISHPLNSDPDPVSDSVPVSVSASTSNHVKRQSQSQPQSQQQFVITAAGPQHAPPTFTLLTINPEAPAAAAKVPNKKRISTATPTPSPLLADAIAVAQPTPDDNDTDNNNNNSPSLAPASASASAPAPATSLTPPEHESSSDAEVEVEQAQLVPLEQQEESALSPQLTSGTLPDYLLELQREDPNIDGPVPWLPSPNGTPLSVIAWDLLPPLRETVEEPVIITEQQPTRHVVGVEQPGTHNIRLSLGSGQALSPVAPTPAHVTTGQVAVVPLVRDGPEAHGTNAHVGSSTTPRNTQGRFPSRNRGTAHYSTTTTQRARPSTTPSTTSTTTTTTTTRPPLTTTTRATTRSTTRATTTTPRPSPSTTPLDPSTFYKLDNEESYAYTLPPWLQDVTDPDLDVAVTFIVPTDNDQYNHTLLDDLEPPFEPFVDLSNIQLTPPPTVKPSTTTTSTSTTTTTTTTTARPTTSTTTTTRRPSTRAPSTTTTTSTTSTTTTKAPIFRPQLNANNIHTAPGLTTTTTPAPVDVNPFDSATLPPWLQDFDYPDVGPGVPYNPDNFKEPETSAFGQQQPGARFDAPAPAPAPAPASNSISGQDSQSQTQFGSNLNANDNQKVEYTKSDEGKVISTPVNTVRKDGQGTFPAAPAPAPAPSNNAGKYTGGFGAPAGLLRPLNAGKPDIYVAGNEHDFAAKANRARPTAPTPAPGRYTGGFGAPSGVLSPQNAPRPFQQAQPQQPQQPQQQQHHQQPQQLAGAASSHQLNRFGGPPGVLVPFDNVQRAPQQ